MVGLLARVDLADQCPTLQAWPLPHMNENRIVAVADAKLGGEECWSSLAGNSRWQINCLLS